MTHDRTATEGPARYVIGIDLGTTNSAVTYVDTAKRPWRVRTFSVPQVVAPGEVEARETLPSFLYQPAPGEFATGALQVPAAKGHEAAAWTVGCFARDHGGAVPGRSIASAKSWLCHSGVDRTAPLLPWHGATDVDRLSPVEASAQYLAHAANAWDAQHPGEPMNRQDVVLTLPASFDEVARELTVKAAAQAGLPRIVLIEEPQAAFYAWLYAHGDDWQQRVRPGQKILVCDIGGGTSDFTLIRVRRGNGGAAGEEGPVRFHRVAVGEHLILGGDNLDLALAHHVERKLAEDSPGDNANAGLEPRQWAALVRSCRQVKEVLLGENPPERLAVNLPGTGSRLIGGGRQIEVARDEVRQILLDGFLPRVALDERPNRRQSGFQEFGLPYAPDPAMTRWLAAFLSAHRHVALDEDISSGPLSKGATAGLPSSAVMNSPGNTAGQASSGTQCSQIRPSQRAAREEVGATAAGISPEAHDPARPDVVLFNGGLFASPVLRERLLDVLRGWFAGDDDAGDIAGETEMPSPRPSPSGRGSHRWEPLVLDNDRLDLAVARGAAYYGMVRRGEGVRIAAGLARTYYIGVEGQGPSAVCLVPAGVEPGDDVVMAERRFDLRVDEPVEFPLFVSSTRLTDRPGELVPIDREQMTPLPPIRTVLRTRRKDDVATVSVELHARLTEIGTLELWCSEAAGRRSWRLQFDVRSTTQTDLAAHESAAESEGVVDEATWQACHAAILATFGPEGQEKPAALVRRLAQAIGSGRDRWPASLLRRIWESLMDLEAGRRRSQVHEARWLNLLGFALRPGFGLAVDDWRVAQTWNAVQGRLVHPGPMCQSEGWILWRRIGGGLAAGQQQAVAEPLLAPIRGLHRQMTTGKRRGGDVVLAIQDTAEVWRLLGSLELLAVGAKVELGAIVLDLWPKRKAEPVRPAMTWALGRIGSRAPAYGPLNTVVPSEMVGNWLRRLMDLPGDDPMTRLAVMQLARRTGDRYRDVSEKLRGKVLDWLRQNNAPDHFLELVRDGGQLDSEEQGLVFGESLPKGLRMA